MRKLICLLVLAVVVAVGAGCATKSSFDAADPSMKLSSESKFEVTKIDDKSGFTPSGEDVDPAKAMQAALEAELEKSGLAGKDYRINVTISEYKPGNAFARWLMPGMGGTYLKTRSSIIDTEGKIVAVIPVDRTVAAGGGFTIGAWRECFKEVAEEIVKVLQREMGILPPKKGLDEKKNDGVSL